VGGFDSPISDHNLEADTTAVLYGVTGGESPLKLVEVAFDVASSIGQSFPFVSASNTITVTMFVNYDLPGDSTITITGLTGTKTDDTDSLSIVSSTLEGTGVWRKLDGSLVLLVPFSGISSISTITASFLVQNGDTTQSTPLAITATGTVKSSGADDSPVPEQTLAESLDDAAGVGGGAVAMLRVKAVFDVADVAQSFPYASGSNQITVNQPFFAMTQPLLLFRIASAGHLRCEIDACVLRWSLRWLRHIEACLQGRWLRHIEACLQRPCALQPTFPTPMGWVHSAFPGSWHPELFYPAGFLVETSSTDLQFRLH
jgi:hypothetical protein